jgi:hypothetical protein
MKERGGFWVDENGNRWECATHTKEKAREMSASLKNCSNCVDCYKCSYCNSCNSCAFLVDSNSCLLCFKCNNCLNCKTCWFCTNCINIEGGHNLENKHYNRLCLVAD